MMVWLTGYAHIQDPHTCMTNGYACGTADVLARSRVSVFSSLHFHTVILVLLSFTSRVVCCIPDYLYMDSLGTFL